MDPNDFHQPLGEVHRIVFKRSAQIELSNDLSQPWCRVVRIEPPSVLRPQAAHALIKRAPIGLTISPLTRLQCIVEPRPP